MADCAILIPDDVLGMRAVQCLRIQSNIKDIRVALDAKLPDAAAFQHFRICGAVRRVTSCTAFELQWGVFENERPLLIAVASDTRCVGPHGELGLFLFEAAVRVMAVAARHRTFKNFVPERFAELCSGLGVAPHAKLRLVRSQHCFGSLTWFLCGDIADQRCRSVPEIAVIRTVCGVALGTPDIVSPVISAAKIIVIFLAGVASQTRL